MKYRFCTLLIGGVACGLWLSMAAAAPKVATSDWTTAETLTAMGLPPISVGDKRAYQTWVGTPPLPEATQDAGLRFQPNLEALYRNRPDMFVQSPWFAHLKPQFARVAPVYEIRFATVEGVRYAHVQAATRELGRLVGESAAAEKLIADTDRVFMQQRRALAAHAARPLAVVQFVDARHVRIYGRSSLYHAVMQELGLQNAWQGDSNEWGFAHIALSDLAGLPENSLLVIVQPHPRHTRRALESSALWRRLPFAHKPNRRVLPPLWSYGGLPSMRHFALQLGQALQTPQEPAW